jgi:hypothetical protein
VIERSAEAATVVACVEELLPGVGSEVVEVTVAVFDIPDSFTGFGVTLTVIVAEPEAVRVPRGHVTVPLASEHDPCVVVAETNVAPAGRGSETLTPRASDGPAFATARL